jgi:hypothetical protein
MARAGEEVKQLPWQHVDKPDVPDNPDNDYYIGTGHVIDVNPTPLAANAKALGAKITTLSETIKRISDTWNALDLGWVGQTQKEADEFNQRFTGAYKAMFGNDTTPKDLSKIASGECALGKMQALADAASKTYANAEDGLCGSFYRFGSQLAGTYKADEWGDPTKPEDRKHPEYKEDIPTLTTEIPAATNPSSTRNYTAAPIEEKTPGV